MDPSASQIDKPIPGSYWVLPGQFLAGEYVGHRLEPETRRRVTAFLEAGFSTFFDLTRDGELPPYQPALAELAAGNGQLVDYRRFPITDFGLPKRQQMLATLDALDAAIHQGQQVYLHCWAGVGRTGTTVGCYLVRHGMAPGQAIAHLLEHYRTASQSLLHPSSPETEAQRAFIRDWQES